MIIFIAIALAAFIIESGAFLLGHDGHLEHDVGDSGHDLDTGDGDPTVSFFSTKVVTTLFMGFGAAGAIAVHYGSGYFMACVAGLLCGIGLSAVMYGVLKLFYNQQASSLVSTRAAVGCSGAVTVTIGENTPGEVGIYVEGEYRTFSATSSDGKLLPKGERVFVLNNIGSQLVVEKNFLN